MKFGIQLTGLFMLTLIVFNACNQQAKKVDVVESTVAAKSLNPNGDSELARLMRKMFNDAKRIKKQVQNGEEVTTTVNHNALFTAHATEPAKAASAEFKSWGKAYLAALDNLKKSTPETAEAAYKNLVNSCMNCHQSLCPGPIVRIKKLKI